MSRPEKEIDWKLVDTLLLAGCLGTEIAPNFDMHVKTFYYRVEEKYGMTFTAYSSEKKGKGEALLRKVQYDKALKGDNTMLVWLGKNRLKQRERDNLTDEEVESIADAVYRIQEANRNRIAGEQGMEAEQSLHNQEHQGTEDIISSELGSARASI